MTRSGNHSSHSNSLNIVDESGGVEALLAFRLGSVLLGLPAEYVREICDRPEVSAIPLAPPYILGVMSLRGEAVALLDLHAFLEIPEDRGVSDGSRPPPVIVVTADGMTVALTADRVLGVKSVALRDLGPVGIRTGSKLGTFLTAECDLATGLFARLNLSALLSAARIVG